MNNPDAIERELYEGDEVMIMTGKLASFTGHIVAIDRSKRARVRSLDENNRETVRRYSICNLLRL